LSEQASALQQVSPGAEEHDSHIVLHVEPPAQMPPQSSGAPSSLPTHCGVHPGRAGFFRRLRFRRASLSLLCPAISAAAVAAAIVPIATRRDRVAPSARAR
jgi:hypothetical protein